jgi:hypothetical protein
MCVIYTSKGMIKMLGCALSIEKYGISFFSADEYEEKADSPGRVRGITALRSKNSRNISAFFPLGDENGIHLETSILF